jgi:hypothetical protein
VESFKPPSGGAVQLPSYDEMVELARICWRQSRVTQSEDVACLFHKMAREFQEAAARLDSGKLPDLGEGHGDKPVV